MPDPSVEKNSGRERFVLYAPLFIWIGVIFFLSTGHGASTQTSLIIRPILEFLFPSAPEETIVLYHGYVRKLAHLTEYAVLGLLACRAFARGSQNSLRKHFYLAAILLVLFVAGSDEINQSFNPDRTGSPFDVLLDLSGGFSATVFYYLLSERRSGVPTSV